MTMKWQSVGTVFSKGKETIEDLSVCWCVVPLRRGFATAATVLRCLLQRRSQSALDSGSG